MASSGWRTDVILRAMPYFRKCLAEGRCGNVVPCDKRIRNAVCKELRHGAVVSRLSNEDIVFQRPRSAALDHCGRNAAHAVGHGRRGVGAVEKGDSLRTRADEVPADRESGSNIVYADDIVTGPRRRKSNVIVEKDDWDSRLVEVRDRLHARLGRILDELKRLEEHTCDVLLRELVRKTPHFARSDLRVAALYLSVDEIPSGTFGKQCKPPLQGLEDFRITLARHDKQAHPSR